MKNNFYLGTGRRKNSTAKINISSGSGNFVINNNASTVYLQFNPNYVQTINAPLQILKVENKYNISASVRGGGLASQSEAIRLALSKALCKINQSDRKVLKFEGYMTTDARRKERKKYGLKKARKAPQFSKR